MPIVMVGAIPCGCPFRDKLRVPNSSNKFHRIETKFLAKAWFVKNCRGIKHGNHSY